MCICVAGGQERREERREEQALLPPHSEAIKASRACSVDIGSQESWQRADASDR